MHQYYGNVTSDGIVALAKLKKYGSASSLGSGFGGNISPYFKTIFLDNCHVSVWDLFRKFYVV